MGTTFNSPNSQLSTFSVLTEEICSVTGQKSAENAIAKAKQNSVFLLFWFSSASGKIFTSSFVSDTNYSVLLAAIIRENFDKRRQMENGEGSVIHSLTWQIGAKGKLRVSSWLSVSNSWKIVVILRVCCYGFFQKKNFLIVKHSSLCN